MPADKAFGTGEFNAKALCHILEDRDHGKTLSELRDDFWRVPRLPLLPNGEQDLRKAIWQALQTDDLTIVVSDGIPREAHSSSDLNLSSDMQRLGPKTAKDPSEPTVQNGGGAEPTAPGEDKARDEKRVNISATLAVDIGDKDGLRVVLDALRNSVEEGKLSWLQISMTATMAPDAADILHERANTSGLHTTVTDL